MSFFIDKHNRRKSPVALAAFGAALLYLCVFGVLTALLAEPLYRAVRLKSPAATTALHGLIIAAAGTAVCCLLFFLKDKRVVPYGFAGLAVVLCMFYAASLMLSAQARGNMLRLVTMFGLLPVLVGNAVTWPIYLKMKRANPALNHRKTVSEELREAVERERAKKPAASPPPAPKPPEAAAGPGPDVKGPPAFCTEQEEARLLYEDDEETSDD